MNESLEYWVWISSMVKINPRQKYELVQYFEDPYYLWNIRKEELEKIPFINNVMIEQLMDSKIRSGIDNLMNTIHKQKIQVVTLNDPCYPEYLKNIFDPPVVIYVKGNIEKDENALAIVGSRRATQYGIDIARAISHKLSKFGITIISGMALGIDSQAHIGALEAGGRTIAVLGCGLDKVYPKENKRLMESIIERGAIISEYVPGTAPMPFNFPARNRLISGMSKGVIVIEASEKSGSLITANYALEQGREVFAVPGNINSKLSTGTNLLIKEGAKVVTSIIDILEELNLGFDFTNLEVIEYKDEKRNNLFIDADENERKIIECLGTGVKHIDVLAAMCGIEIKKLNSIIVLMELKGILEQLPGKLYRLKENFGIDNI